MKAIRDHLLGISLDTPQASVLVLLMDMYGLTGQQIGEIIDRSQSQVVSYRNGTTALPPSIKRKLTKLLIEARGTASRIDVSSGLLDALIDVTDEVLKELRDDD